MQGNRRDLAGRLLTAAALGLALTGAAPLGVAQEKARNVVALRLDKVPLYEKQNDGAWLKTGEKRRDELKRDKPWPIDYGKAEMTGVIDGYLQVVVDGKTYGVRPYAVETDKLVAAGDCDAKIGPQGPKTGATRGLGENCLAKP
jgi:hypothetical protein